MPYALPQDIARNKSSFEYKLYKLCDLLEELLISNINRKYSLLLNICYGTKIKNPSISFGCGKIVGVFKCFYWILCNFLSDRIVHWGKKVVFVDINCTVWHTSEVG